jgi:homoserine kinase
MTIKTSKFQQAIEAVEALSSDEQAMLLEIMQKRLVQQRRERLLQEVTEAERDYARGNVKRGSVGDFLAESIASHEEQKT